MKKLLHISVWTLLLLGIILLPAFSAKERKHMLCAGVKIQLAPGESNSLLSVTDLEAYLRQQDSLTGKPLQEIKPEEVENLLKTHPYVARAEAHLNLQGQVIVDIWTEQALLRIQPPQGSPVYLSERGRILPLRAGMPVRLAVANGFTGEVPETGSMLDPDEHQRLYDLYRLGKYLQQDPFFHLLFSQIYCKASGDFLLVPRLGRHTVLLGKMDETLEEKMENLRAFYTQGLQRSSWDRYTHLNLTYKNQVVCTKR